MAIAIARRQSEVWRKIGCESAVYSNCVRGEIWSWKENDAAGSQGLCLWLWRL